MRKKRDAVLALIKTKRRRSLLKIIIKLGEEATENTDKK